jgi:hypothetical protein
MSSAYLWIPVFSNIFERWVLAVHPLYRSAALLLCGHPLSEFRGKSGFRSGADDRYRGPSP